MSGEAEQKPCLCLGPETRLKSEFLRSIRHLFLTSQPPPKRIARFPRGAIAQLGERLHGMQEVAGSIPASSTKVQLRPHRLEA
jgi:hypothetical protein